jgi:hypothetical protein
MGNHFTRAAAPIRDLLVKRMDRQPVSSVSRNKRMKSPSEPMNLDDVAGFYSLQPHR